MSDADSIDSSDEGIFSAANFRYTSRREARNAGKDISRIADWFPATVLDEKLPKGTLNALWKSCEEPSGAVLETSFVDDELLGLIQESLTRVMPSWTLGHKVGAMCKKPFPPYMHGLTKDISNKIITHSS